MSDTGEQRSRRRRGWRAIGCGCGALLAAFVVLSVVGRCIPHEATPKAICLTNISQLAKAMRLYTLDHNGYLFFDRGDAFSPPLVPGQYGQSRYLKQAMKAYVPEQEIWYCPSDTYRRRDFSCDTSAFGTFSYRQEGVGYTAIPHAADSDPGIRALRSELVRLNGADPVRLEHNEASYQYVPFWNRKAEGYPVRVDVVVRAHRREWGPYGYWDINPSSAWVFEEDVPAHFGSKDHLFGDKIYGKTYGFRDGHCVFHTYDAAGINQAPEEVLVPR